MPPVIRRRALSPRGVPGVAPVAVQRSRFSSLLRLTIFFGMIAGLVYFASGFREAVEAASERMSVLRSSTSSNVGGKSDNRNTGLIGLTANDDVVELVRPTQSDSVKREQQQRQPPIRDPTPPEEDHDDDEEEDDEPEANEAHNAAAIQEDRELNKLATDPQINNNQNEGEEDAEEAEVPEQAVKDENAEQQGKGAKVFRDSQTPQEAIVEHEEDDAPVVEPQKVAVETDEAVPEEDLDNEEHAVDENAQDVVVESAPSEEEEDDDEEVQAAFAKKEGPRPMPRYKREELEERGFGHVLYAYRVVAPYVAIRTKPSPIGGLAATSKDKMGLTKDSHKMGEIIVGYKLAKVHGLWLKIGPYTWAPVTKKETPDGQFHPVMKQIRKISIPGNLRKYWRTKVIDCNTVYKKTESRLLCQDKNMIRNGVLNVMRRMKLIDSSMDPDIHPFPSWISAAARNSPPPPRRALHLTSMTPGADDVSVPDSETSAVDSAANVAALVASASASAKKLAEATAKTAKELAENAVDVGAAAASSLSRSTQPNMPLEAAVSSEGLTPESQQTPAEPNDEDEDDDVDTDVQCKEFKYWHLCARHAKCAWRRLPNLEYCDLDTDPPIDESTIPAELKQDPKYDFPRSAKANSQEKYFVYQPSGGWNNQRLLLESALIICKLLNRTCVLPPAAPHSNYFQNYNNIPASALVGMPRVLNFEALNSLVPTVAIPRGQTFRSFLDDVLFKEPRQYSIKTIFRDVTKYKPGTMKKWGEKDIIRMFGQENADVLYFANQTLWGSIEWKGSIYGWKERKMVHSTVMYPNHMKQIARKLAERLGPFHAVHVRRGDKVFETSFSRLYHDPEWYATRIAEYKEMATKVYIATDEPNRSYFDAFKEQQLSIVFWESLPGYDEILRPYLSHFPKRMFMDVLGMVEQLLCSYAVMFLGSGYSTFTTYILRLRKYRDIIATDTSFGNPALGLPESVRNLKSTCDPIKALGHSKPC